MSLTKQTHEHDDATLQRQTPVPANTQAPTHAQDNSVDALAPATHADTLARSPEQVLRLQRTLGNRATGRLVLRSVQRDVDSSSINTKSAAGNLEKHIGLKSQQQDLIASNKHGQGMAEELVRKGRTDTTGKDATSEDEKKGISDSLRRLVEFTKFDDSSSISVLARAADGGLSNEQKWNVIKVNTEFMSYIVPGMMINKIIPEHNLTSILGTRKMTFGNSVGGSVAHEMNYNQGLTGAESVSNFGLDYGGYTDVNDKGRRVAIDPKSKMGPFTKEVGRENSGREKLASIPNVFYVQMKLPDTYIPDVKVPMHGNIISFAQKMQTEILWTLSKPQMFATQMAMMNMTSEDDVRTLLQNKLKILTRFLEVAKVAPSMLVSTNFAGKKNVDDPLTNLGITKPGARLQNKFGTINQEYYFEGYKALPEGSGLFLKDSTGTDKKVGELKNVDGQLQWENIRATVINIALRQNETWRKS